MQQKLLGQLTLVLEGAKVLKDHGSITLTTGVMNHDFVRHGSAAAMINNAVEGFAQAAALDLPRGIRLNVVSPALLQESVERYKDFCPGFEPVSSATVARAYRKRLYGIQTGQVFRAGWYNCSQPASFATAISCGQFATTTGISANDNIGKSLI